MTQLDSESPSSSGGTDGPALATIELARKGNDSDEFGDHDAPDAAPEAPAAPSSSSGGNPKILVRRHSISEEATEQSSGRFKAPWWLSWFERPFQITDPSTLNVIEESTGWAMDAAARGPLNQAGTFVGTAILRLATIEAGCRSPRKCPNTVYGLLPSSILTTASTIVGLLTAVLMPIAGAIVDHTRHRKVIGATTAMFTVAVTGVQLMISEDTWFPVLILEMVGGFSLLVHITAVNAYLPDLTNIDHDIAHYTSRFNIRQYGLQTVYNSLILGIGHALSTDTIETAKLALGLAFVITFLLMAYAWTFLFRKRPPLSEVPEGSNLLTSGFRQLGKTGKNLWSHYHSLRWFMIALLFSPEAGAGVVLAIAVTFLTIYLNMTGLEIGLVNLVVLIFNLPGSAFSKFMCVRFNPLTSFRLSLFFFAICVGLCCAVLNGPDRNKWTYLFAVSWGFCFGWMYPSQRVLYCTLIPKGQETEFMGLFAFFGQILGWLPALAFTSMNENGVDMRWGMSLISWFLLMSLICTFGIGSYETAVSQVRAQEKSMREMNGGEINDTVDLQHHEGHSDEDEGTGQDV